MTVQQFDVIEAVSRCEFNAADDIVNVYQFQLISAGAQENQVVVDDVISILESIYTIILAGLSILYTFRDVKLRNITQSTLMGVHPWPVLVAGTNITNPLAPGVALLSNWGTDVPRVGMRKFFGGLCADQLDPDGTWLVGVTGAAAIIAAQLLVPQVIGSRSYQFGYLSPKTLAFEAPNSGVGSDIPAYQRRRKQGRGS